MKTEKKEKENESENIIDQEELTQELPILPLDDLVVFPYMPPVPPFPPRTTLRSLERWLPRLLNMLWRLIGCFASSGPKRELSKEDIKDIKADRAQSSRESHPYSALQNR